MSKFDESLKGKVVTKVLYIHDYFQIYFGSTILNVYNPHQVSSEEGNLKVEKLVGLKVYRINTQKELITICFEKGVNFAIDISDDSYTGPEAVSMKTEDEIFLGGF